MPGFATVDNVPSGKFLRAGLGSVAERVGRTTRRRRTGMQRDAGSGILRDFGLENCNFPGCFLSRKQSGDAAKWFLIAENDNLSGVFNRVEAAAFELCYESVETDVSLSVTQFSPNHTPLTGCL
ncbi:hypothetical protein K1T73_08285 [Roseovarius sp. SCSIO 43702]|uniref:hypothetical protein n=1 Tax=Roseovarius sp. SCSIO 43702 TaxID=2823043 RepID=UPI001C731147|nr:hypothetical protein [Roseovarius sp. SCSIO 43702]QYX58341.1 hypothetical protein K1T73_08285 [Roseovarius sp. SCSIO 43702]